MHHDYFSSARLGQMVGMLDIKSNCGSQSFREIFAEVLARIWIDPLTKLMLKQRSSQGQKRNSHTNCVPDKHASLWPLFYQYTLLE